MGVGWSCVSLSFSLVKEIGLNGIKDVLSEELGKEKLVLNFV